MPTEREQPEHPNDAWLSSLLTSAHDVPKVRREFVTNLAQRLDAEFAAQHGATRNGTATHAHGHTVRRLTKEARSNKSDHPAGRKRRWVMIIASAAVLLVAMAVWSNPPAWAAALRVIAQQIATFVGGGPNAVAPLVVADGQATAPASANLPGNVQPATAEVDRVRANDVPPDEPRIASAASPPTSPAVSDSPEFAERVPAWQPFAEPLSPHELSDRIDNELAAVWRANGIHPVGPASDEEFMRRVYLDLTGRIPFVSEVQEFLEDAAPNRRELLVDRLLDYRDHATHMAAVWRSILLPSEVDVRRLGGTAKFDEWLAERFAANVPYDQLVRDLLLAEGRVSESGPLLFYAALKLNPDELAARTSRAFLGVRMECAQCHDHPFDEVSQRDFWSFAAFFARISRPQGKMEMTSPVLAVRDNEQGDVTLPNTQDVVSPRLPLSATDRVTDSGFSADVPAGPPRRAVLVDWLTSTHNGQFARAAVNRVWAHLFGRGLVEPVDDMRPANAPIAPQVLDTLSRDLAASRFDMRRLLRALVLTKTYQLSSRSVDNDPARTLHFAQMNIKCFTAEQLYDCISVAAGTSVVPADQSDAFGLLRFADTSRQAFIEQFRAPAGQATDYHAGIPQALTLMHGGLTHSATDVATSGLLKSLAAPFFSDDQRIDTLFLATLSRYPTDTERKLMLDPVKAAGNDAERQQALGDVLWALLNSAAFTFNH